MAPDALGLKDVLDYMWVVVCLLVGFAWRSIEKKIDSVASDLKQHITEDIAERERIAKLEATSAANTDRIKTVGDQGHRFNAAHADEERDIRKELNDRIEKLHMWLTEQVIARMPKAKGD